MVSDELLLVVKTNVAQALAGLETVEKKASSMGTNISGAMTKVGKGMLPVTIAIGAIGAAAGGLAMSFETEMATLQANAGFTAAEIEGIEGAILGASSAFGESTGAIADAAFMLKSSGMSAETTAANLDAVGMAANANLGEMGDLAQLAGVAFANFGMDAVDTFDILTVAAGNAIVGPDEMGKAFQQLMGPSGAAGQSLEEMAKNTTILTNAFGSARFATTKYKAILTKTLVPAESAVNALKEIGMTAEDFKKSMSEDVIGTLEGLQGAFNEAGMSDDEWIAAIFPDAESFTGAAALLGADSAEAIGTALNESSGALEGAFDTMADTAEFKLGAMKQSAMNSLVPIGSIIMEAVVPALAAIGEWLGKASEWFQGLDKDAQKNILKWAAIVAAIAPVLLIGAKVVKLIQAIGAAMTFLAANPIGLVIVAIAALVAAGIWLYKNWDEVVAFLTKLWEGFSVFFTDVWESFKGVVSGVWETIKGTFKSGVNSVLGFLEGMLNKAIRGLNHVIELANKIPGVNIGTIGEVSIPRLAKGGTVSDSGLAMVGEKGPEVVSLPKGATVHPTGTGPSMNQRPQEIHLHVGDKEFAKFVMDQSGLSQLRQARRVS